MIFINSAVSLQNNEVTFDFIRASGPGGQNVNKVSTAAQLRFSVKNSPSLNEAVKNRLIKIAGKRVSAEGILIIDARRHRSQSKNREDALNRLKELIIKSLSVPKPRRKTKPTLASKEKRLRDKKARSKIKQSRKPPEDY